MPVSAASHWSTQNGNLCPESTCLNSWTLQEPHLRLTANCITRRNTTENLACTGLGSVSYPRWSYPCHPVEKAVLRTEPCIAVKTKWWLCQKNGKSVWKEARSCSPFLSFFFFFFFLIFFFFPKHLFVLFYLQPLVFQRGRLYFTSKRSGPGSSRSPGRCPAGLCPSSSPAVGRLWDLSFSGLNRAAHFWSLKEMKLKSHWRSKQDPRTKVLRWQSKQSQRRAHAARAATGPPGSAVFHKLLAEL